MKVQELSSYLSAVWKEGRLGHGILLRTADFHGVRESIASFFAQHLSASDRDRFLRGQSVFAEWMEIKPEADLISVESIRTFLRTMGFPPVLAPFRALVIHQASAMNPQAANAFLKLLEEPPRDTFLFLISAEPLMATIESRCQCIRLQPLSVDEICGGGEGMASSMAYAAEGSRQRWEELREQGDLWQRAERELLTLWEASPKVPLGITLWLEKLGESEVATILSAWQLLLRDTVLTALEGLPLHRRGTEWAEPLERLAKRLGSEGALALAARAPAIAEAQLALRQNGQEKLQMAALLSRLQYS